MGGGASKKNPVYSLCQEAVENKAAIDLGKLEEALKSVSKDQLNTPTEDFLKYTALRQLALWRPHDRDSVEDGNVKYATRLMLQAGADPMMVPFENSALVAAFIYENYSMLEAVMESLTTPEQWKDAADKICRNTASAPGKEVPSEVWILHKGRRGKTKANLAYEVTAGLLNFLDRTEPPSKVSVEFDDGEFDAVDNDADLIVLAAVPAKAKAMLWKSATAAGSEVSVLAKLKALQEGIFPRVGTQRNKLVHGLHPTTKGVPLSRPLRLRPHAPSPDFDPEAIAFGAAQRPTERIFFPTQADLVAKARRIKKFAQTFNTASEGGGGRGRDRREPLGSRSRLWSTGCCG